MEERRADATASYVVSIKSSIKNHSNLQLEHCLELYVAGMLPWDLEMTVEEPLSDDEDEDGVPHCVSDSDFIFSIIFIFYLHIFVYILSAEPVHTDSTRSSLKTPKKKRVFLSDT